MLIGYAIHLDHPLNFSNLPQSPNGRSDGSGRRGTEGVGTTGVRLVAGFASPDTNVGSLDGDLATVRARVSSVLGDFHLLDGLPEGGTVTGTVFTGDTDLLCSLGLKKESKVSGCASKGGE